MVMYKFICEVCSEPFENRNKNRKYCSRKCSGIAHSEKQRGENSPFWKGGTITKKGYRRICVDGKQILEHRYIMQQFIGRQLLETEEVHHKDENKLNNNIDNLVLTTSEEHSKYHVTTYRDEEKKQCTKCLIIKSRAEFSPQNRRKYDNNHPWCRLCFNECQKQRKARKQAQKSI